MKNLKNTSLIILVVLVVALGCKQTDVQQNAPIVVTSTPNAAPVADTKPQNSVNPPPKETAAAIKWSDYDRVYNTKSNSTDMQKDALWKNFEGKTVNWTGTVEEVSKGMFGGLKLNIKMNEDTMTYDIALDLKDSQADKAMSLTKGKKVSFTGRLKSAGGKLLPLSMDEGEIK